jgi:hypothetical protein
MADGVEPASLYPIDYDRAFKKLDTLGDNLVFWDTGAQSQTMMENNEVDMLLAWNGRAYNAAVNGSKFVPAWDQNIVVYDVFMIPVGAPNKDLALQSRRKRRASCSRRFLMAPSTPRHRLPPAMPSSRPSCRPLTSLRASSRTRPGGQRIRTRPRSSGPPGLQADRKPA